VSSFRKGSLDGITSLGVFLFVFLLMIVFLFLAGLVIGIKGAASSYDSEVLGYDEIDSRILVELFLKDVIEIDGEELIVEEVLLEIVELYEDNRDYEEFYDEVVERFEEYECGESLVFGIYRISLDDGGSSGRYSNIIKAGDFEGAVSDSEGQGPIIVSDAYPQETLGGQNGFYTRSVGERTGVLGQPRVSVKGRFSC